MNWMYRIYQFGLKLFVLLFPFPRPKLFVGQAGLSQWLDDLKSKSPQRLLLVTDQTLVSINLLEHLEQQLQRAGIEYTIFSDVQPNPTIANVEQGLSLYQQSNCNGLLCVGGGSVMDCAKLIGARVARPNKSVKELKGLFKIIKSTPRLYAIPTTAGTGSETTIVAVISDPESQRKYAVTDLVLTPTAAILLPELTQKLPPHITAATGMDALTHAVESYIGVNSTPFTRQKSLMAIKLIFKHLPHAYEDGNNLVAREKMLLASFYAGEAFTRASVGYVHAIAHQLGALYNTPHGLANAIILPKVLNWYGHDIWKKLAEIADHCDIGPRDASVAEKARWVLEKIDTMNNQMQIPTHVEAISKKDIGKISRMALEEAHPDYPVPKFMSSADCKQLLHQLTA